MRKSRVRLLSAALPCLAAILLATVALAAEEAASPDIAPVPPETQRDIEDALKAKVSSLLNDKNDRGVSYKRGTYSKDFRKIDDTTYHATFHVDTADVGSMKTERFLLTLKKDS